MILVPLLLMPLLTVGMGISAATLVGQAMQEIPKVMILGGEDSPRIVAELRASKDLPVVACHGRTMREEISNKEIRAAVEIPPGFDAEVERGRTSHGEDLHVRGRTEIRLRRGPRCNDFSATLRDRAVRERLEARQLPGQLDPARSRSSSKTSLPPKRSAGDHRRAGPVLRDSVVPDRRDVSGHGPDRG